MAVHAGLTLIQVTWYTQVLLRSPSFIAIFPVTDCFILLRTGVLLHYDDPLLRDLYFLDPQWLCDMLAHVVTIREVNPHINNGKNFNPREYLFIRKQAAVPVNLRLILVKRRTITANTIGWFGNKRDLFDHQTFELWLPITRTWALEVSYLLLRFEWNHA